MFNFIEIISYILIGIYVSFIYNFLVITEPFSFYLPGGISKYYKVHINITKKFEDIVGFEDIKKEFKAHLKYFQQQKISKGFIFQGQSGCGKTLMAKAIAGESKLPFIEIFTNNLKDDNIPTVINTIINKYQPCIIFIDECYNNVNSSKDILMRELNGMSVLKNVFLIFSTSTELNPSICRFGRFDKIIKFQLPTYKDRLEMFKSMGYEKASKLAQKTCNLSFADISIIPQEVEFVKMYEGDKDNINILSKVIDNIRYGRCASQYKPNFVTLIRLAYHEIGHLLMSYVLKGMEKPNNVTIIPSGKFAGSVSFNTKDNMYKTQSDIYRNIIVLLASSVFETHYLGEYSTLCEDDFERIDELFELLDKNQMLGYTFLRSLSNQEDRISDIMLIFENIIKDCIKTYEPIIQKLYTELILHESLHEDQINKIIGSDPYNSIDISILDI